jgi:hypothetical protein
VSEQDRRMIVVESCKECKPQAEGCPFISADHHIDWISKNEGIHPDCKHTRATNTLDTEALVEEIIRHGKQGYGQDKNNPAPAAVNYHKKIRQDLRAILSKHSQPSAVKVLEKVRDIIMLGGVWEYEGSETKVGISNAQEWTRSAFDRAIAEQAKGEQ